MTEHIKITEQWSLRKLQLADHCEWALQYLGMDWIRMCEFLPSKSDTMSMDEDVRKFAEAIKSENERLQERVADLQAQWGYSECIQTLKIERLTAALESMIVDPPATLDEPDRDAEVIFKMRAIAAAALNATGASAGIVQRMCATARLALEPNLRKVNDPAYDHPRGCPCCGGPHTL